jgi:hypothetical protein
VIVFDADFVGIALLPVKCDPVLTVDANTVSLGQLPSQPLQSVAGRNQKIFELRRHIEHLQLPLHNRPQFVGHAAGGSRVPFTEQICGRLVGEGVNHDVGLHIT